MDIQVPHLWFPKDPLFCSFGTHAAALCRPKNFLAKVLTPEFTDIGNCGPPLSISNVTVSPVPGKFPFRILAFSSEPVPVTKVAGSMDTGTGTGTGTDPGTDPDTDSSTFSKHPDSPKSKRIEDTFREKNPKKPLVQRVLESQDNLPLPEHNPLFLMTDADQIISKDFPPEFSVPVEQANYVLELPPEGINVLSLVSGSLSSGDQTLLHLRTSIQPFQLNFSGAIDLEFSHLSQTEGSQSSFYIYKGCI